MAELTLTLRGRQYAMACDDNEVDRVMELTEYVNKRLDMVAGSTTIKNESHLLVLTALVLADEALDAKNQKLSPSEKIEGSKAVGSLLESITNRIVALNEKIDKKRA